MLGRVLVRSRLPTNRLCKEASIGWSLRIDRQHPKANPNLVFLRKSLLPRSTQFYFLPFWANQSIGQCCTTSFGYKVLLPRVVLGLFFWTLTMWPWTGFIWLIITVLTHPGSPPNPLKVIELYQVWFPCEWVKPSHSHMACWLLLGGGWSSKHITNDSA